MVVSTARRGQTLELFFLTRVNIKADYMKLELDVALLERPYRPAGVCIACFFAVAD